MQQYYKVQKEAYGGNQNQMEYGGQFKMLSHNLHDTWVNMLQQKQKVSSKHN